MNLITNGCMLEGAAIAPPKPTPGPTRTRSHSPSRDEAGQLKSTVRFPPEAAEPGEAPSRRPRSERPRQNPSRAGGPDPTLVFHTTTPPLWNSTERVARGAAPKPTTHHAACAGDGSDDNPSPPHSPLRAPDDDSDEHSPAETINTTTSTRSRAGSRSSTTKRRDNGRARKGETRLLEPPAAEAQLSSHSSSSSLLSGDENEWEENAQALFSKAPTTALMLRYRRSILTQDVLDLIEAVRTLPWTPGVRMTPMTNIFNGKKERKSFHPRKADKTGLRLHQGFYFFCKEMRATSFNDRMVAYLGRRATIGSLMQAEINNLVPGRAFLNHFVDDLVALLGEDNHLTCLANRVLHQLDVYVVLACNIFIHICDQFFCPEHTPKAALETCKREENGEILDLVSRVELLVLRLYRVSSKPRSYIYDTLGESNPQVIYDTHQYLIDALRRSPQSWSGEISAEVEQLCLTAREQARRAPPDQRAQILTLQNILFSGKVIGADRQRSLAHAQQRGKKGDGTTNRTQPARTLAPSRVNAVRNEQPHLPDEVEADQEEDTPLTSARANAAPTANPRPTPNPPRQPKPDRPSPEKLATGRPDCREISFRGSYIDFAVAAQMVKETDNPKLRALCISLWPSDDCSRWEQGVGPQATPILDDNGHIQKYKDGSVKKGYQEAKSCRYCSVWCANMRNNVDCRSWGPPKAVAEFKQGKHNPRSCARAQLACMMAGPMGLSLLKESRFA